MFGHFAMKRDNELPLACISSVTLRLIRILPASVERPLAHNIQRWFVRVELISSFSGFQAAYAAPPQ